MDLEFIRNNVDAMVDTDMAHQIYVIGVDLWQKNKGLEKKTGDALLHNMMLVSAIQALLPEEVHDKMYKIVGKYIDYINKNFIDKEVH